MASVRRRCSLFLLVLILFSALLQFLVFGAAHVAGDDLLASILSRVEDMRGFAHTWGMLSYIWLLQRSSIADVVARWWYAQELAEEIKIFQKLRNTGLIGQHSEVCSCDRVPVEEVNVSFLRRLNRPTVLTGLLKDASIDYLSRWTREALLNSHGDVDFPDSIDYLHKNGAGVFVHFKMRHHDLTLREILELEQPGNLFVVEAAEAFVQYRQRPSFRQHPLVLELFPESDMVPAARMLLEMPSSLKALSFGSKSQWNQVHTHPSSIFVQVKGRKGWVLAPGEAFFDGKEEMEQAPDPYRYNLRAISQEHVCGPWMQPPRHIPGGPGTSTKTTPPTLAHENLTSFGRCCEVAEGEALITGGWWHGTCDLDDWSAGFVIFL